MAEPDRMGSFDAVLFGVESDPLLRSVIVLVVLLDRAPDEEVVLDRAERMTRLYPTLRQRPVGNPLSVAPPRWETDPDFDFDYHIRWRRLGPRHGPLADVLRYAERMSEQDFDHARPLWEVSILTEVADDRAAFILKIHHALTDGMGGMEMAAILFDVNRTPADLGPMPDAPVPSKASVLKRIEHGINFETRQVVSELSTASELAVAGSKSLLRNPIGSTVAAAGFTGSAMRMLAPQGAPLSPLMTRRSLSVTFSVLDVGLEDLITAAHAVDATLNELFMTAVAGALADYHRKLGAHLDAIRVNMPVSTRAADDAPGGNRWVPARFIVPVDTVDTSTRVRRLRPVLRRAERDPALHLSGIIYRLLTILPRPVTTLAAGSLMKGVDVAATNIPGPDFDVFMAGARVTALIPFAPKAGAAVNIALMSCHGRVHMGINCDRAAVSDPALLTECLRAATDEVVALGTQHARTADAQPPNTSATAPSVNP